MSLVALRKRTAIPLALLSIACVVGLSVFGAHPRIIKPLMFESGAWGAALFFAFAGYGGLVGRFVAPGRRVDLGLKSVWGASLLAFLTISLANFRLARTPMLVALVAIGVGCFAVGLWRERVGIVRRAVALALFARRNPGSTILALGTILVVVLYVAGSLGDIYSNPYDDDLAYAGLARQLIARGTMVDPFSLRRASALGAQSIFHGLLLANGSIQHLNFFDRGIAATMLALMIAGFGRGRERPPGFVTVLAILMALVFFQSRRVNLASNVSGLAFFFGIYRTTSFFSPDRGEAAYRRGLGAGALVTATTCALRQSFIPAAGVMFVLPALMPIITQRGTRRTTWIHGLLACLALGVFLLPWLSLFYESTGALLYPLQRGYMRMGYAVQSSTIVGLKELRLFLAVLMEGERSRYALLFFVLGLAFPERDPRRPFKTFLAAAFIGLVMLTHSFTITHAGDIARYGFGFTATASIAAVLFAGTLIRSPERRSSLLAPSVVALALLQFEPYSATQRFAEGLANFDEQRRRSPQSSLTVPAPAPQYTELQHAVPAGEKLMVMLDEPCYLDYERNEIFSLDLPGALSPPPSIPFFRGPEAFADYFVASQKIRYLAFVDPMMSRYLYRRALWLSRLFDDEELWRTYAPYFLDAFDNVEALRDSRRIIYEANGIYVLDLATRASDAERIDRLSASLKPGETQPTFAIAVRPEASATADVPRMEAAGFDLAVVMISARANTPTPAAQVDALVSAISKTRMRHAFQIRVDGRTTKEALGELVADLEKRGLMDRAFERQGNKLLFVEPETESLPLPRYTLRGYEIIGVTRWARFDGLELDADQEARALPGADMIKRGYGYIRHAGYIPQFAQAWLLDDTSGIVSIAPGWRLGKSTKTTAELELDRRGGRTLVEQYQAALAANPQLVVFYAWNDDESGVAIGPMGDAGTFYVELAARLMKRKTR